MEELPKHQPKTDSTVYDKHRSQKHQRYSLAFFALSLIALFYLPSFWTLSLNQSVSQRVPAHSTRILSRCTELKTLPGFPVDFYSRSKSNRFDARTKSVLIRNGTLWTGSDSGKEHFQGDILLDGGIIKWIGGNGLEQARKYSGQSITIVDAEGAWVTPGIVDMHSHIGVDSLPSLNGASDTNSLLGITQPWLRSLDGLNTHDESYTLSVSGGVTTANILPGSANAIGGQAFVIKLRSTSERSPSSKLVEEPGSPNSTGWRQMKHACGENPSRVYSGSRLDTIWAFRAAYNEARQLVEQQDKYCAAAEAGHWSGLGDFPDDLKWEALADVIRGKVKVHNHCYEAVDFDGMVRVSRNEVICV